MEVPVDYTFREIRDFLTSADYDRYFIAYPDNDNKSRKEVSHSELVDYMKENNFSRVEGYEKSEYGEEFWYLILENFHKKDEQ